MGGDVLITMTAIRTNWSVFIHIITEGTAGALIRFFQQSRPTCEPNGTTPERPTMRTLLLHGGRRSVHPGRHAPNTKANKETNELNEARKDAGYNTTIDWHPHAV